MSSRVVVVAIVALLVGVVVGYVVRGQRSDSACVSALAAIAASREVSTPNATAPATITPTVTDLTIKGADLDAMFTSPDESLRMARIVPNTENGVPNGMRLFAIRPDTTLGKSGFMNGDVVTRVNGHDVAQPDALTDALNTLRGASAFDIEVMRRGSPIRLHFAVER